jgi:hypothetical protein
MKIEPKALFIFGGIALAIILALVLMFPSAATFKLFAVNTGSTYCSQKQCDTNQATVINQKGVCTNAGYTCSVTSSGSPPNYCLTCTNGGNGGDSGACSLLHPASCTHVGRACTSGRYVCTDAFKIDNSGALYCDVSETLDCGSPGCSASTGTCNTPNPSGAQGYEICQNGNVLRCNNGGWSNLDTCSESETCTEHSLTNAECILTMNYYCYNSGTLNCIHSTNPACYSTLEECNSNIPVVCLSADLKKCTQRSGACLTGERTFKGSDIQDAMNTCSGQIPVITCNSNSDCDDGNTCTTDICSTNFLNKECTHTAVANCEEKKACEAKWYNTWVEQSTTSGGYICSWLGIGCTKVDTSYCAINPNYIALGVIILIISAVVGIIIWRRKK